MSKIYLYLHVTVFKYSRYKLNIAHNLLRISISLAIYTRNKKAIWKTIIAYPQRQSESQNTNLTGRFSFLLSTIPSIRPAMPWCHEPLALARRRLYTYMSSTLRSSSRRTLKAAMRPCAHALIRSCTCRHKDNNGL